MASEEQIRVAVFQWLDEQTRVDDVLSWHVLQQGFRFGGRIISLVGQQGIWKPKVFQSVPISIRTSHSSPYNDGFTADGLLYYRYRGTDPSHHENAGLREAMHRRVPLVYFHGLMPGKYLAAWPVYIVGEDPAQQAFIVALDDKRYIYPDQATGAEGEYRRRYITTTFRTRLHQRSFRLRVLAAYQSQCAFCRLRRAELLDAAHIIPDSDPLGEPTVNNGLALCKIHHAAFDRHFIGVTPDYRIVIRKELLEEEDGPMLRHGIQAMHGQRLVLPRKRTELPDRDLLALRYELFQRAM
ncbi:MAG TPA: HNH endonuclease [Limnochordia bacterium]|nr:HNH endonuclease [Limnochordia bacterium]